MAEQNTPVTTVKIEQPVQVTGTVGTSSIREALDALGLIVSFIVSIVAVGEIGGLIWRIFANSGIVADAIKAEIIPANPPGWVILIIGLVVIRGVTKIIF